MGYFVVFPIPLTVLFTLTSATDITEKSHNAWLTKFDNPELNPDWLTDLSYKLKKISKHGKSIDLNVTLLQDVDNDSIMCELKVFQKSGGKYMKAPADVPPMPCCAIMKSSENTYWPCMHKTTNLPKNCPVPKGIISMKDFNPSDCVYPPKLPPRSPEDYKLVVIGTLNSVELWKFVAYGVIKKRMESF